METAKVLLVEDEPSTRDALARLLENRGHAVSIASDGQEGIRALDADRYDVLATDLHLPGPDGLRVVQHAREVAPETIVLLVTAHASVDAVIEALRTGVADCIQKPVPLKDIAERVCQIIEKHAEFRDEQSRRRRANVLHDRDLPNFFVGRSASMRRILELSSRIAPTDSTVLISGESGVGKEVVARTIHQMSHLSERPFLAINCAAIPENLLESQLFGHRKGSFTGADRSIDGLFVQSGGGTIFLDEIGELPGVLQAKLLRAIEAKEVLPIGAARPVQITGRIIAATNRNLREAVSEGAFREDLYYRLNVFGIEVPPLRDRREDIPFLIERLVMRSNARLGFHYNGVSNGTMAVLLSQPWNGNVRELDHALEYAMVVGDGEWVRGEDLPPTVNGDAGGSAISVDGEDLESALRCFERAHIEQVLHRTGQNRRLAAKRLGIHLATLYRKIQELDIAC